MNDEGRIENEKGMNVKEGKMIGDEEITSCCDDIYLMLRLGEMNDECRIRMRNDC